MSISAWNILFLMSFTVATLTAPAAMADPACGCPEMSSESLDITACGAVSGDGLDDSCAIAAAVAQSRRVTIPPGTFHAANIPLAGPLVIVAEGATVIGANANDPIFTTSGPTGRITIRGGDWKSAGTFYRHQGNGALIDTTFDDLTILYMDVGFDLSSTAGVLFRHVAMSHVKTGIFFAPVGYHNTNTIEQSKFQHMNGDAIVFSEGHTSSVSTRIQENWFESISGSAIILHGATRAVSITKNYFEANGSEGAPDVVVDGLGAGSYVRGVKIRENYFGPGTESQTERLFVQSAAEVDASDNEVRLKWQQVFARFKATGDFESRLYRNFLTHASGGIYAERLFVNQGNHQVSWSVFTGSGFVTDDEFPLESYSGVRAPQVRTIGSGPTPSVRAGHVFVIGAGASKVIQNFAKGHRGQTIRLLADRTVLLMHSKALRLRRGKSFLMRPGCTLVLTMYKDGQWHEDSRSYNP